MSRLTVSSQKDPSNSPTRKVATTGVGHPLLQPYSLFRAVWKQRIPVLIVWAVITAVTIAVVLRLPRTYQAQATLLVGTTGISKDLVANPVPDEVMDRLEHLKQRALSHDFMMDFMAKFGLHEGDRKSLPDERVMEMMHDDIEMKLDRGWGPSQATVFRISVQGKDPVSTMKAANYLANFFIQENRIDREGQADAASDFFTTQMAEAKQQVESSEARLNQYKSSYAGELPQQQDALLATLAQARTQLQGVQDALSRSAQNRLLLNNSLELAQNAETSTKRMLDQLAAERKKPVPIGTTGPASVNTPGLTEVQRAEAELAGLRQRYGDAHPDVRRTRTKLEQARAREAASPAPAPSPTTASAAPAEPPVNLALDGPERDLRQSLTANHEKVETLKAQMKVLDQDDARFNAERVRVLGDIAAIDARIRNVPLREQEMSSVIRDYDMGKERYQSMVNKKLAADLSRKLEQEKAADTVKLADPARVPEEPTKPKRSLLAAGGSIFGLLLGLIAAVALEMRSEVLLGEWELPPGTPVLGRVVEVRSGRDKSQKPERVAIA